MKKESFPTRSSAARRSTSLAKAASRSRSALALRTSSRIPSACAACCRSFVSDSEPGLLGLTRTPITAAVGNSSRSICSRFAPSTVSIRVTPVMLPPGRRAARCRHRSRQLPLRGGQPDRPPAPGALVPLACLGVVLRHALTILVKPAEAGHGDRVAFVSGLLVPLACLGVVLRHTLTALVKPAELGHGARVALVGGLFIPLARLGVVLRHAPTVGVKRAEEE